MTGLGLMNPLRSQLGISFSSWNSGTSHVGQSQEIMSHLPIQRGRDLTFFMTSVSIT